MLGDPRADGAGTDPPMSTPSPHLPLLSPQRWPGYAVATVTGFLGVGLLGLVLSATARDILLNVLNTTVFLLAALAALGRAQREPIAALGWRLVGGSMAAQCVSQALALSFLLRHGAPPPFPSTGEGFSFLSLGLVIASLLAWPLASASGSERLRKGLDGLGLAIATFFITWFFALGPLFNGTASPPLGRLVMVAFFLSNATTLGICAYLGARQPWRFRGPLGWLMAAFAISLLQVTLLVPLSLAGRYYVGHPLDLLVLVSGLSILLASLAPHPIQPGPGLEEENRDSSLPTLILPILPSALAVPFVLGVLFAAPDRLDRQLLAMGMLITALGLFRGLLALRDLQRLSAALEARVQERTRSLEAAQELLLKTERLNGVAILGAGLAHDFKNLLGVIRLRSDLLALHLGPMAAEHGRDLDGLRAAVTRAESLAADLLAFGRDAEDAPVAVDLLLCIQRLGPLLRATLPTAIALRVDLPPGPAPVRCQPGRLDQLVVNLVLNARDAMPEGGTLRVGVALQGSQVELTVSDTGVGIPADLQSRIFEPFFTTKDPGRGTGLGLASVHQTVRLLGGTLDLVSEPGQGTTFTLRFPVCG
jgi:signal transduction histidine kinase